VVGPKETSALGEVLARRVRVLIVDDSEDVRLLLRVMLQRDSRFEIVSEAADGFEAIQRAADTQPDLVVLDLSMPRLGGIEALPQIRERVPNAAVVIYSARLDAGTYHAALAAGAAGVVEKSVVGSVLVDQLANALLDHWAREPLPTGEEE
jgi:two-component system response regulator DegU